LESVFETILANATRICEAKFGILYLRDGEAFRLGALHGAPPAFAEASWREPVVQPGPRTGFGCVIQTKQPIHIVDVTVDSAYAERDPLRVPLVEQAGARSFVIVPMLKANELIGTIAIYRQEVRPFSDKQIDLLTNFASQAVIAIENTRLLNELRESLQQQTATADVLKVISRSTFDLQSVLQALIESATRLCGAPRGHILQFDGEYLRLAAAFGAWPGFTNYLETHPLRLGRGTIAGKSAFERRTIHVRDVLQEPDYELTELIKQQGYRTVLAVPMLREGALRGVIVMVKTELEPFTDKQIELVETFADQAVIAIENVRLFDDVQARTRELTESLEYQTATGNILRVISSSPTDVQPVFDTIAESAVRLCGGQFSFVMRLDGGLFRFAGCHGLSAEGLDVFQRMLPRPAGEDTVSGRAIMRRAVTQVADVRLLPGYAGSDLARVVDYRSIVAVPLLRNRDPIGVIAVARAVAGSFPERQIALLQTFAEQAVIAIGNVRLFDEVQARTRELSESLAQQTATADVLKVISRSTFDLKAVLKTLVESAARLCEADMASINRPVGDTYHREASYGFTAELQHRKQPNPLKSLYLLPILYPLVISSKGKPAVVTLQPELRKFERLAHAKSGEPGRVGVEAFTNQATVCSALSHDGLWVLAYWIFADRVLADWRRRRRGRLLARQIGGSGNAQHGDEPSRYDYNGLHDANPLVLGTRTGRPSDAPIPLCLCKTPACTIPRSGSIAGRNGSRLFVALAMDRFKCDWQNRERCRLTKWSHASRSAARAKSRFIATILYRSAPACAYLTTADASNLLLVFPVSFVEADYHMGRRRQSNS
jgi:GAF domain-containing protein